VQTWEKKRERVFTFSVAVSGPSEPETSASDPLTWRQIQFSDKGAASSVSTGMSTYTVMLHLPVKLSTSSYKAILLELEQHANAVHHQLLLRPRINYFKCDSHLTLKRFLFSKL